MLKNISKIFYMMMTAIAVPFLSSAQDTPAPPKGLDERINEWFQPITDAWSSFVFYTINLGSVQVPLVVILLVCGALFFTLYFSFVNIRRFGLAIEVVRGKHDDI